MDSLATGPRRIVAAALAVVLLGVLAASCRQAGSIDAAPGEPDVIPSPTVSPRLTEPDRYVPLPGEPVPEVKQLSSDVLQAIGTYGPGGGTVQGAAERLAGRASASVAQSAGPLLLPGVASAIDIIYPQLSGLTETQAGMMTVYRQRILENGTERSVTGVADLRLRRTADAWTVTELASLGGGPRTGKGLTASAQAVLQSDRISLPDPARWDVQAGEVDDRVLKVLLSLAEEHTLDVTVFASAHPRNVFARSVVSNHAVGRAVDIWAVDGTPVVAQRQEGSPLRQLVGALPAQGVTELGAPWDLDGPGTGAIFADIVHQDHLHLAFDS